MIRVGIIGLGVGERHIAGFEADERCRVVALIDQDPAKLAEVSNRNPGRRTGSSADEILNDPEIDVVSIASYDRDHHSQVMRAIEAGKHVFVEKPLCLFENELQDIRSALRRRPDIKLSSNLILRRTPRFIRLRERIQHGEMGEVYYLEGDYNYGRLHKITEGWRGKQPYYSVVHGGAIHLLDLLMWLTGQRPAEVFAFGSRLATSGTSFSFNDCVAALLRFPSGMLAKVTANFACVMPHTHLLSVYGTAASFQHGPGGAALYQSRSPDIAPARIDDAYPGAEKGDLIPSFVRSILDGSEPEISAADVLDCMAVSLAIEAALQTNAPVRVDYH